MHTIHATPIKLNNGTWGGKSRINVIPKAGDRAIIHTKRGATIEKIVARVIYRSTSGCIFAAV